MVRYIAGIDEAGRGPLAGPVAVGVALVPLDFDWSLLPGVGDSKALSEHTREVLYREAQRLRRRGTIDFTVSLVSASTIDRIGISSAVARGINRGLKRLAPDEERTAIRLDGLLIAPPTFTHQETIIHGDALEPVIGLASILAKVTRDRLMVRLDAQYPHYGFATHKGYGTAAHRRNIQRHGLSPLHRATFCTKLKHP